jgi:uncharacterized protein YndB with AHSA1/START domain
MTNKSTESREIKFERTIPAPPGEVFDAWLNPKIPGTPWHEGEKLILNPKVDGLFYWLMRGQPHYGRFTEIDRPGRIQHTWMSRNTLGEESTVTVTFQKKGEDTLMILLHSDLPNNEVAKAHEKGWIYFLDKLVDHFGTVVRQRK